MKINNSLAVMLLLGIAPEKDHVMALKM